MGSTRLRRPPAPTDAERARSLATRGGDGVARRHGLGAGGAAGAPRARRRIRGAAARRRRAAARRASAAAQTAVMLELADRGAGRPARTRPRAAVDHRLAVAARAARGAPDGAAGRRRPPGTSGCSTSATAPRWCASTRARRCSPTATAAPRSRPSTSRRPARTRSAGFEDHWLRPPRGRAPRGVRRPSPGTCRRAGRCRGARMRPLGVDRCGLRLRVETADARPRRAAGVRRARRRRPRSCA